MSRRIPAPGLIAGLSLAAGVAIGCGSLKNADPTSDGGASTSGSSGSPAGSSSSGTDTSSPITSATGPGEHGALPSGYCCTMDAECRDRHCAVVASGDRMCLDTCRSPSACFRTEATFVCDGSMAADGYCQPPTPTFRCLPQAQFKRGTRLPGACCEDTGNGNAGAECDGDHCVGVNDNPLVCSQWCDSTVDCPSAMICSGLHECVPGNATYTCN